MRLRTIIISILLVISAAHSFGSPAKRGHIRLIQPDGSSFAATFRGDEFTKIKTTADGYAIMQDENGWWCYATFDDTGARTCSGWKVGQAAPDAVLTDSRHIPHELLARKAASLKAEAAGKACQRLPVPELMTAGATKAPVVTKHGIVILAEFQDVRFESSEEDFEAMLTQTGYDRYGATGSAKEYFEEQFAGVVGFEFDVSRIVTLKGKMEYYGGNDSYGNDIRPTELIIEACRLADQDVDFSAYDDNGDGVVDNVFVFFAGDDEAEGGSEDCIWSHSWYLSSVSRNTLTLDGCIIDGYACASEMTRIHDETGNLQERRISGIGTFCHEYSHTFGLADMYDTDYDSEGGWAAGLWGSTSIMDGGNQNNHGNTPPNFNAIERYMLGITDPIRMRRDGTYSMLPINIKGEYFLLESEEDGEFYLFECRSSGQKWDAYIGGSGMLVYHIDRREEVMNRWNILNNVNSDASHQHADLVEADGRADSFTDINDYLSRRGNIQGVFFPYKDMDKLLPGARPGLNFWSGYDGKVSITEIRMDDEGGISFNFTGDADETTPPSVRSSVSCDAFCDGAILNFKSNREYEGAATVSYGITGQRSTTVSVMPYIPGHYAISLEGLKPSESYTVTMSFSLNGVEGKQRSVSFMTKSEPSVKWPYMHFGNARRNNSGSFLYDSRIPLKVVNAMNAADIRWTFNDEVIQTEGDYYYTLTEDGILKAYITWEDGSEDVVIKEITLSPLTAQ